jgi:hypothetical protein
MDFRSLVEPSHDYALNARFATTLFGDKSLTYLAEYITVRHGVYYLLVIAFSAFDKNECTTRFGYRDEVFLQSQWVFSSIGLSLAFAA